MSIISRRWSVAVLLMFAFVCVVSLRIASAQEDAVHTVSGVVKHFDRGAKMIVVKTDDGVEHSVKWTDKTAWEGAKESGKGIKEGSMVTVKYTEKAGEKTAVGVKHLEKDAEKAVH